jgi:anti-sigma B factor antagonist
VAKLGNVDNTATLEVTIDRNSGQAVVALSGELDISTVDALAVALKPLMAEKPECVCFDLDGLRFMDSSGIAVLIRTAGQASVSVIRPTAIVRKVLEMTGLTEILGLEP